MNVDSTGSAGPDSMSSAETSPSRESVGGARLGPPQTIKALLVRAVRLHPERPAMRFRQTDGWHSLTWLEVGLLVSEAGRWLENLDRPERLSLVAPASAPHTVLELAALLCGCDVNPIYDDADPEEVRRVLDLVTPSLVATAASTREAVDQAQLGRPAAATVVDLDEVFALWRDNAAARRVHGSLAAIDTRSVIEQLSRLGDAGEQRGGGSVFLQSTGTTGPAKVIEIRAAALLHGAWAVRDVVRHPHPRYLAFLPSGHISHQLINIFAATLLAGEVCYGDGVTTLLDDLAAIRPTVLFGSPLLYGGIRDQLHAKLAGSAVGRLLWRRLQVEMSASLDSGVIVRGGESTLGRIMGRKVARSLGLHLALGDLFSGTSPLDPELHAFFGVIGWYVRNTYGVTECGGAATISGRDRMAVGDLGAPVEGISIRLDSGGQVHLAGPSLMNGYVGAPPLVNGTWFATGDLVTRTAEGALQFTGRITSTVECDGVATTLDAIEKAVEEAHPGFAAVVAPGEAGGYDLLVLRPPEDLMRVGDRPTLPTATNVARVVAAARGIGLGVIAAVGVVDEALSPQRGEIGPTGKIRRWRVHDNWRAALVPIGAVNRHENVRRTGHDAPVTNEVHP